MTRVNLVPVEELTDQHLFAEFREIKMVPKSCERSLQSLRRQGHVDVVAALKEKIPCEFTLNKGHVLFFCDKGLFLARRFHQLRKELDRRGVNYNKDSAFDPFKIMRMRGLNNDYTPDRKAMALIRERIAERISAKPSWYRYYGKSLP